MNSIERPSILYVEDDEALARLVQLRLVREGYDADTLGNGRRALARLRHHRYDVVLVDFHLPELSGMEVLRALSREGNLPPTIMVSGAGDLDVAVQAMRLGAADYVVKELGGGFLDLLMASIERVLETQRLMRAKELAEEALRRSEEMKSIILASAIEGIITIDDKGLVVDFNPAAQSMFGYATEEALGREMADLIVPPYMRAGHRRGLERYLETGEAHIIGKRLELTAMRKWGEEFPVELSVAAMTVDDRRFFTAFIRDITQRRRAEEELHKARYELELRVRERTSELTEEIEERKRAERELANQSELVDLLHRVAVTANTARSVDEAMQAGLDDLCAYTRWPLGHIYFRSTDVPDRMMAADIWHVDDAKRFAGFKAAMDGREFARAEGLPGRVLATGQPAWIVDVSLEVDFPCAPSGADLGVKSAFAMPVLVGREVGAVMEFFSDRRMGPDEALFRVLSHIGTQLGRVLERARAEASLRKLSRAVEQSGGVVIITALDGTIEYVNPKFSEVSGYSAAEVIGRNPRLLKSGESSDQTYRTLWQSILAGQEWRGEFHNRRKDGSLYWVAANISPVKAPDGVLTHIVAIEEDITERKKAAQDLLRAKETAELANRAKTEFLANMSHELRTPLNSIIGFSQMLSEEIFGPLGRREYKEYARDITDSGMHLLDLINDILDVSRIETDALTLNEQDVNVKNVMVSCHHLIQERAMAASLVLRMVVPEVLPGLRADERRLKQILLNLLSNAVKFTPEGGAVTCRAGMTDSGGVEFVVSDSGIGIAPDDLELVMSPFGQADSSLARKYEGAGLGLPLSKKLVELHQGTLELKSELGVGTVVTVRFPETRTLA